MRATITPQGKPPADPADLVRVQVCRRAEDGTSVPDPDYAFFGADRSVPAWHVPALVELAICLAPDRDTAQKMRGHPFYDDLPKPSALIKAAFAALMVAEHFRDDCREGGKVPACRWILPAYRKASAQKPWDTMDVSVLTWLVEASDALVLQMHCAEDVAAAETRCREVTDFVAIALRYPSIPPEREAELMKAGYTVAEYLVHGAVGWILRIADEYENVQGPNAGAFASVARKARLDALTARHVIERGVRYTLEGRHRK